MDGISRREQIDPPAGLHAQRPSGLTSGCLRWTRLPTTNDNTQWSGRPENPCPYKRGPSPDHVSTDVVPSRRATPEPTLIPPQRYIVWRAPQTPAGRCVLQEDDGRAIARLKQGDIVGLEHLVRKYQVRAIRAAYMVTGDLPVAEDIVQEAFLRVFERAAQFDDRRPFAPWFLRIVVNDALKAAARQGRSVSSDLETRGEASIAALLPDPGPGPQEMAEQEEVRQKVWEALERLPPEQRAAIVLRHYVGLPEKEIALRVGRPLGTVKWLLHAARKRLRTLLSPLRQSAGGEGEHSGGGAP